MAAIVKNSNKKVSANWGDNEVWELLTLTQGIEMTAIQRQKMIAIALYVILAV